MNKFFKKSQHHFGYINECGRSMVEILGVLAIIGVLSIGGIQGYTYAMNKNQANNAVGELNALNTLVSSWFLTPHENNAIMALGNPYDNGHIISSNINFDYGCGADTESNEPCDIDETGYYFILDNIPQGVCRNIAEMTSNMQYYVEHHINDNIDEIGTNCVDGNNRIEIFFDTDETALSPDQEEPEGGNEGNEGNEGEPEEPEEEIEPACPIGGNSAGKYETEVRLSDLQFNDGDTSAIVTCGIYTGSGSYMTQLIGLTVSDGNGNGPTREELIAMDWSGIKEYCSEYMANSFFTYGGLTWSPDGSNETYYIGGRKKINFAGGYTEEPIAIHHSCAL